VNLGRGLSFGTFGLALGFLQLAGLPVRSATSDEHPGAAIYARKCAECHGEAGEGVEDRADDPLQGNRSIPSLAKRIERTMPEDKEDDCVGEEARLVAEYIYGAFYSPEARARNAPVRMRLARLTVPQYRHSVADLLGSFRGGFRSPGEKRGLTGHYFASRRFRVDKKKEGRDRFTRLDSQVRFEFGPGIPRTPEDKQFTPEAFSIRWEGSLIAPQTGEYEFVLKTRNGVLLWLNEQDAGDRSGYLIDGYVAPDNQMRELSAKTFLLGGRAYPLRLDFFTYQEEQASVELWWKPPHGVFEPVPARVLTPDRLPETFVADVPFPPDDRSNGYERGTAVSDSWFRAVTTGAIDAAGYVSEHLDQLAGIRRKDSPGARTEKLRRFGVRFVETAFRRPLSEGERRELHDRFFAESASPEAGMRRLVLYALTSPAFLYPQLEESGDSFAVASRLALGLWDSIPDAKLIDAARKGTLRHSDQLDREIRRMLRDDRTRAKLRGFFHHWLELDRAEELVKDNRLYPEFSPGVLADLRTSLTLFLEEVVWNEPSDYRQLLLADHLFLNERLAELYGAPRSKPGFRKVTLRGQRRAGVITHPFLLASLAYHDNTSPIHRGVFLTRNIVGMSLKPPPEAVAFEDAEFDPSLTMREKVTQLTRDKACMACHATINPLGFSLEHFDAIGRWRTREKNQPINAQGEFTDAQGEEIRLRGARDVARYAAESPSAHRAFIHQVFHHFVKQPVAAFGPDTLDALHRSFRSSGFHVQKLLSEIARIHARDAIDPASNHSPQTS